MHLEDSRYLSGPNLFAASPVSLSRVELDELTGVETTSRPGFARRLQAALPGVASHHCSAGRPGGFTAKMARGTYFGHVAEHIALELSSLAGREVHLGRTIWAGADGRYDVMMECPRDEPASSGVPAELLRSAITIVGDLLAQRPPAVTAAVTAVTGLLERERLGVSTAALAAAARRRGIPVRRVGDLSMLRLGYGTRRHLVCAALTDQTSAVGVDIAADKELAKQLLAEAGIPVPAGVIAATPAQAAVATQTLGGTVVVKPRAGSHGASVVVGITAPEAAAAAFSEVSASGSGVIVERYIPGTDYRVLVAGGHVVAAAQLQPAAVTGDGRSTIAELIGQANADPRRGEGHSRPLTTIVLDDQARAHLAASGMTAQTVPAAGQSVVLRENANLSTGGTSADVTGSLPAAVTDMCRRAASVTGLDVCGVDLRMDDAGAATVIEVNACPGLRMHEEPAQGPGRDVAGAIVDSLYPAGVPSRIPVISVTGTNGKTSVVRMAGHLLSQAGLAVGMATTDGVYSRGRLVFAADASGPRSAQMVLDDTSVEAAVLETARGGLIRGGLGYDRADVAVITNISADHLGADGIDDLSQLADVKALVAEEIADGGTVVLNADDPAVCAIASRARVRRHTPEIRYFSLQPGSEVTAAHRQAGGITCELRGGELVEFEGSRPRPLLPVAGLPGAFGGGAPHVVANALAAIAACRALGVSAADIRQAMTTFAPSQLNPGRGCVYCAPGGGLVVLDYGHNAAALEATGRMIATVWGGDPVAAITLPGDRRDDLIAATAQAAAAWFGRIVIYEDCDKRGRAAGEMTRLIAAAIRRVRPGISCVPADGPQSALRAAVTMAAGSPVLLGYEKLAAAQAALHEIGARPLPQPGPQPQAPHMSGRVPAARTGHGRLHRADAASQWNRGHW